MKKLLSLVLALLLVLTCVPMKIQAADGIAVDETNFPDDNFRAWILEQDYGADGVLTQDELADVTEINVFACGIQDMTGIAYFTTLEYLYCHNNDLTSLDVSKNTALKYLSCGGNDLTSLDVSANTALVGLSCQYNQLASLDISANMALENLECSGNDLTSLDISVNTALEFLGCGYNDLTSLDVSKNTALTELNCGWNQLTSLNVSANTALVTLSCFNNQLTSLDVSKNAELEYLYCDFNQLTSLDVSKNTALEFLGCGGNELTGLDVSQNTDLRALSCQDNQLTSLDISANTALEDLSCSINRLTSLDVSKNTALKYLNCDDNQLTSLDVSKNTDLVGLGCYGNQRTIRLDANDRFDLTALPGFDATKTSNWEGGTVSGTVLTVYSGCESVTYTYQMGNGWSETFTLKIETEAADPDIIRLAGANRFDTAIQVADEMKSVLEIEKFDAVILANGYNFADALAGSYLSTVKDAPILLTWNGAEQFNYLNDATIQYVKDNLKPGGTVYILGGTAAVPASIDAALSDFNIARMDGANRFETNIMILEEAGVEAGSEILVCTSTNFADSLSASAAGKPILLVYNEGGKLFDNQKTYLEDLENCTFTVVGGESAVSAGMLEIFSGYGETTRLAGSNRFETSVLVAEKYFPDATSAVLAYAWDFPDGLCGGGLANAMGAPLILTMTNYESQAVDYIRSKGIAGGIVLGGEKLISEGSVHLIFGLIAED